MRHLVCILMLSFVLGGCFCSCRTQYILIESGKTEFGNGLCNPRFFDLFGRRDCFSFNGYGKYSLLDECYYVRVLRVDSVLYLEGVENGKEVDLNR